jgi:hypothetical protein
VLGPERDVDISIDAPICRMQAKIRTWAARYLVRKEEPGGYREQRVNDVYALNRAVSALDEYEIRSWRVWVLDDIELKLSEIVKRCDVCHSNMTSMYCGISQRLRGDDGRRRR